MKYLDIKKQVMTWLLIALIIIIAEAKTAQDRNQTHLTCNQTQVLRQGKDGEDICCHSAKCKFGETFLLCSENNGSDICSPCGDEYFTALSVDTALVHIQFDPCIRLKCPDGAVYTNGSCTCDISNGYYGNDSSTCIQHNCTIGYLLTLNGDCRLCEKQDNCTNQIIKRQSSNDLSPWTLVGTVLLAIFVICGTVVGIVKYRRRKNLRRHEPFSLKKEHTAHYLKYKTCRKQKDLKNEHTDRVYSEPSEVVSTASINEFDEQYSRGRYYEEEGMQQAQPLNPRPVVVGGNSLHHVSSFSSRLSGSDYLPPSGDGFQSQNVYTGSEIYNIVDIPQAAATINEFQPVQVSIGKRRRLPSPIERRVSDDQEHVINDYPSQYSDPHIRSSNQCNKILNVDFLNEHVHTDRRLYLPLPVESSFSEDECDEMNDASFHPHIIRSNPYDTVPKVDFFNDLLHTEEHQYFSHFLPKAGNMTGNDIKLEVETNCSEEDNSIFYERYHRTVAANGELKDGCRSEVVSNNAKKANISFNLPFKSRSLTCIDDVKVQFQSHNEEYSDEMNFQTAARKDLQPNQLENTRFENNTASRINQEDKLKEQCVRPKELGKPKEKENKASPTSQDYKEQCVRPKELGKPKEKENKAIPTNQDYKFNTTISECHAGITITPIIQTIIQKARSLEVERRNKDELIEHLQCIINQQRQTIERLQKDLQEFNIIKQENLTELAHLLGIDPSTDKSEPGAENNSPPFVPRRRHIKYSGFHGYTTMDLTSNR